MALEFAGAATRLAPGDIDSEAKSLGCDPAAIRAVCDIESAGGGFLPDGRPKILFEAHVFGRLTGHRFDALHPNVSAPAWDRALYGAAGAHQYDRLGEAIALDRRAALQSASWGMFQILGTNFAMVGFADVESFVAAMVESERRQLDAFVAFCRHAGIDRDLREPVNFGHFAAAYNGPGQVALYAARLDAAYHKWRADPDIPAFATVAPRTAMPASAPARLPPLPATVTPSFSARVAASFRAFFARLF